MPKVWPRARPRLVVRVGLLLMLGGILALLSGIELDANAGVVALPMVLIGLGMGALSSQLGAVTVSSVPTEQSGDVGGLQNTATNLGASIGTALAGSVMIAVLTSTALSGINASTAIPASVQDQATVELASGIPFVSDTQLEEALADDGLSTQASDDILEANREARVQGLDAALGVLAVIAVISLFFTRRIPAVPVGDEGTDEAIDGAAAGAPPDRS